MTNWRSSGRKVVVKEVYKQATAALRKIGGDDNGPVQLGGLAPLLALNQYVPRFRKRSLVPTCALKSVSALADQMAPFFTKMTASAVEVA